MARKTSLLKKPFTTGGDSILAGNVPGIGNQPWSCLGQISTGCPSANQAVGGTTSAQILTNMANFTAAQLAGDVALSIGRNDINSAGYSGIVANTASCAALITGNMLLMGMPVASVEPLGSFNWAQVIDTNRQNQNAFPTQFCSLHRFWQTLGDGGTNDNADLAIDLTPRSVRTQPDGSIDSLHGGAKGNVNMARGLFDPWTRALHRGGGYIQPWQEFWLTGSAAATAQTNGGFVAQAAIVGTVDSVSIVAGNGSGDFAISGSGAVTRATATVLTGMRYDLTVQIVRDSRKMTGVMRIYIGASNTVPVKVVLDGKSGAVQPVVPTGIDTQKLSGWIAFQCAAGTDGTDMYIWGTTTPNAKLIIHRNSSNRLVIIAKNSSSTTVYSVQTASSGAGLITASSGIVFVFFSIDLTAGTPSATATLYVNETSSMSFITGTSGATMNLSGGAHFAAAQVWSTGVPTLPFSGTLYQIWMGAGFIDWSNSVNRALVYTSGTLTAKDIGTGSITPSGGSAIVPLFYLTGNAADWASGYGLNRGSAGRFVTASQAGATITVTS